MGPHPSPAAPAGGEQPGLSKLLLLLQLLHALGNLLPSPAAGPHHLLLIRERLQLRREDLEQVGGPEAGDQEEIHTPREAPTRRT